MGYTLVFFLDVIPFAVMFFSFAVTIVGHPIYYLVKNNRRFHTCEERFFFFFGWHGNESYNLIGSLRGQYFPISAHGQR